MELSRALHLASSIQSREGLRQWVSYVFAHATIQWRENEVMFAALYCVSWSLRSTSSCWHRLWGHSPELSPLRLGSVFDWKCLCRDEMTRWHNNLWTHSLCPAPPLIRLAIYLSQGSSVHGQRESERVVECYWLLWSLKITEFHWCCNRAIISFDEAFENVRLCWVCPSQPLTIWMLTS